MAKHRSKKGRRRGNVWEVRWTIAGREHLVQETNYTEAIRRVDRLSALPWVSRWEFRQLQR